MQLTNKDFKFIDMAENRIGLEAKLMNHTVCLEPCANGYDVAIYEKKKGMQLPFLVGEKTCTNLPEGDIIGKRGPLAIEIANQKLRELKI